MWGTEAVRDLKRAGEEGEEQVGGMDIPEDAGHTRSKLFPRSLWEGRKEGRTVGSPFVQSTEI